MMKAKKTTIWIISTFMGLLLLAYLLLGFFWKKPGMNGFTVMHGVIRLYATGEDYVEVGENKYLYQDGALYKIIENEYESYRFLAEYNPTYEQLSDLNETSLYKAAIVSKDGKDFKATGVNVGLLGDGVNSLYYVPYEEK